MVIIWGSSNYGKCDEVPGLCHVSTRFGHLYYIPLIPTQSFAVISEDEHGFRGANIPMSGKSILLAWLRAGSIVGLIVGVVLAIMALSNPLDSSMLPTGIVLVVGGLLTILATYRMSFFRLASRERAREIGEHLGLDPHGMQMIEDMYDAMETPTPDDDFAYNRRVDDKDDRFQNYED